MRETPAIFAGTAPIKTATALRFAMRRPQLNRKGHAPHCIPRPVFFGVRYIRLSLALVKAGDAFLGEFEGRDDLGRYE